MFISYKEFQKNDPRMADLLKRVFAQVYLRGQQSGHEMTVEGHYVVDLEYAMEDVNEMIEDGTMDDILRDITS